MSCAKIRLGFTTSRENSRRRWHVTVDDGEATTVGCPAGVVDWTLGSSLEIDALRSTLGVQEIEAGAAVVALAGLVHQRGGGGEERIAGAVPLKAGRLGVVKVLAGKHALCVRVAVQSELGGLALLLGGEGHQTHRSRRRAVVVEGEACHVLALQSMQHRAAHLVRRIKVHLIAAETGGHALVGAPLHGGPHVHVVVLLQQPRHQPSAAALPHRQIPVLLAALAALLACALLLLLGPLLLLLTVVATTPVLSSAAARLRPGLGRQTLPGDQVAAQRREGCGHHLSLGHHAQRRLRASVEECHLSAAHQREHGTVLAVDGALYLWLHQCC
mmetsp:Transcript_13578/g.34644  ORF Transcript_13578/g.34644 Transcript_13578/m.34644 type:complete len:329 (-) Transcript_13578:215-1201(-)